MNQIKCLVLSDSHGRTEALQRAIRRQPNVDAIFFLGDGLNDLNAVRHEISGKTAIFAVKGNCDFGVYMDRPIYKVDSITLADKKIIFTHGDLYGVKYGMDGLIRLAEQTSADIILFGHTHEYHEEYIDGVYYLNPGSVKGGFGDSTAGVLTIADSGVLFSRMEL